MKVVNEHTRPSRPAPPRDGGKIIKGFVQQSEQRRVACRFARSGRAFTPRPPVHQHTNTPHRPHKDDRLETRSGTPVSGSGNQEEESTAAIVGGLFTSKHVQRNRQISLTPAMLPAATAAAASGLGANNKPIFTFTRRKLQMESISSQNAPAIPGAAMLLSPSATSQSIGHRSRVSNLAAKLDTILRSSPWMRRKVVVQPQMNSPSQRGFSNVSSHRLLSSHPAATPQVHEAIDASSGKVNEKHYKNRRKKGYNHSSEDQKEMEKRVMATFRRFVRLWRERKRRSEQAALNIVTGNGGAKQNNALSPTKSSSNMSGRHGVKLRRELDAQSSNVASILSRRMIGEVPALKFFDEGEPPPVDQNPHEPNSFAAPVSRARSSDTDDEEDSSSPGAIKPQARTVGDMMASSSLKDGGLRSPLRRATPRGVCYTLDSSGCRRIKMQSGAPIQMMKTGKHTSQNRKKSEEITIERATSKSLRRKMIRRVKVKHQAISRLTDEFARSKSALTAKLGSQLALRQAEGERMFGKRLSLHLSNNAKLPPHMTSKELTLARLRFKKANLQACCQTLSVLGAALHHIETAGEVSGREISTGEQRFLELLRCAVEGDHALTPLLIDGIRGQFSPEQRQKPLVAGLLGLLALPTDK